jgi:hypothetical protein
MAATLLVGGCCSHPGVFGQLEQSLKTVQACYEPLVQSLTEEPVNEKVRAAMVAADTTLLLLAQLQAQWCPALSAVEQVRLQAEAVRQLAEEAGVTARLNPETGQ